MGTIGDLASIGAVAIVGYLGFKWISGQGGLDSTVDSIFRSGSGGGSGTTPSPAAKTIVDGFGSVQQDIADATAISKATSETVIDAANLEGGLVKDVLNVPIIGGWLSGVINGLSSKAATEYVTSPQYQGYKAAKEAAETTTTPTAASLQELRSSISNTEGLTASQKRDLERSLRKTVA